MAHDEYLLPPDVSTVLCDADGTLFPSEEPAYVASALVTRDFAERYGLSGDFSAENLRRTGLGRNFRSLTADLLAAAGIEPDAGELQQWIEREKVQVTDHLARTLSVGTDVLGAVRELADRHRLAVVSSSATPRLLACLDVTGLAPYFPAEAVFSAEDSLATPSGKPAPDVYLHAARTLGVDVADCVAIEDSPTGVRSAVAAGIRTVGLVQFVPAEERAARVDELLAAGALSVAASWAELTPSGSAPQRGVTGRAGSAVH